ncbi:MAG: hypothetical protein PUF13_06595 [Lachnospiraceae bacterium]|nr:hypothetical protein [Lachnospiraceae bacterium]
MKMRKNSKNKRMAWGACFALLLCTTLYLPAQAVVIKKKDQADNARMEKQIREAKEAAEKTEVGRYGMLPVYGRDIADGTYEIEGESSSVYFKIGEASLTVKDGQMEVRFMIPSLSYSYVFLGTGEEAQAADEEKLIEGEEIDSCTYFTIPVESLDTAIDCAAYSKKRQKWYDRKILFDASSLPEEALKVTLPDYEAIEAALKAYETDESAISEAAEEESETESSPEPVTVAKPDGEYSIEVNMTGGSGRASISSPTLLIVRDGRAYAKLLWSSAYYDYMIVEGETYWNLTTDGGNSTFEIPITVMDEAMPVIADTTAMGEPVEIAYTLNFYQDSIGDRSLIPQEAAKKVLVIAAVIIVAGGILNYFVKKKRR